MIALAVAYVIVVALLALVAWDEAEAGHARVVAALREGVKP